MSPTERAVAVGRSADGYAAVEIAPDGRERALGQIQHSRLAEWVRHREDADPPRWVIRSATSVLPDLLAGGVRLSRAHDLVLCHALLRDTDRLADGLSPDPRWVAGDPPAVRRREALFEVDRRPSADTVDDVVAQFRLQRALLQSAPDPRLALLCAAESAGGLIAEEMRTAGLPWDAIIHDEILTSVLGPRPAEGALPARMLRLAETVRERLGSPALHLESRSQLLRALRNAGIMVESTSRWELAEHEHPAIEPLIVYKKLARLLNANGWAWCAEWVHEGRFRPVYVPGGVVTGRWASAGGGALQIPRLLRPAVRADPGWTLIVADVAQLEPRVLAGMSGDEAMADAARGADLYAGVVASGAVSTREEAKYAVLGAMYGATTGDSGRLVPRLRRVYPRAMALVDDAAATGEAGGVVTTWLGRSSPPPSERWLSIRRQVGTAAEERHAGQVARERGRFTRNFVVQGTAAEWSLIWLAEIRYRLARLHGAQRPADASGPAFAEHPHLAFFLHDEVIVHTPLEHAAAAAEAVREAARVATRRMFGAFPIEMPLDLRVAHSAAK